MVDWQLLVSLGPDPPHVVAVHPEHADQAPGVPGDQEPPEHPQSPDVCPGVAEAVPGNILYSEIYVGIFKTCPSG